MSTFKNEETLLFGAIALELEVADREAVVRALEAWARDPSQPIGFYLDMQGVLDPDSRARVEESVRIALERHENDPGRAPATIGTVGDIRASLSGPGWVDGLVAEPGGPIELDGPADVRPGSSPVSPPDHDPFETNVDGTVMPSVSQCSPGSDINPIPSGLGDPDRGLASSVGGIRTPDLGPPSSMDILSGRPSAASGSDLPRFDPYATVEGEFDPSGAISDEDPTGTAGLPLTEVDPNATAFSEPNHHDPMATSADGLAGTLLGSESGSGSGATTQSSGSSSRFRIVRAHAKGGLGAVMVAFDEELRREVALKEIQDRHADNPDSRSRFLLEAEITGGLEHPGVVPVYSLGRNPDGRPFYAMRFIRGDSLRKAIGTFHDPEHGPRDPGERALQLRALLRRFIDVCNALEYAHSRGVIHRDIKPDNIMLGPYGETLVVDWGLAKAIDHVDVPSRTEEMPLRPVSGASSTPTLDGSAIGTPAFMSPEQAEGDLARMGPPSDVYSLGATLYQILTGLPPFTERNLFQILLNVRNGQFPPPRAIKPEVPAALEAICLTAMARSIDDRYDSCRALADDLEHWLADEPVSVHVEPLAVRLGRWAKRHRTLVASGAVLLLTAVIGLSIGMILLDRERAQTELQRQSAVAGWKEAERNEAEARAQRSIADRNAEEARGNEALARENARIAQENELLARENAERAEAERTIAETQRMIAERNFEQAVAAVDSLLTEVGEIDLADVPQMEQTRRDLLTKARSFYERFLDENETPEARRDAGRARSRLGDIHELLGEYAEANASYLVALEIQVPLAEANPDDEPIVADLARTRHSLAVLLKKMNEFSESESLLNQARAARAELVQDAPDHLEHKSELASSTYQLGTVLSRLVGRGEEARRLYDTSIEMQREVVEGRGGLEEDLRELGRYLNNLALLLQGTEPGAAGDAFEESIGLQRRLVEENSDVPHYGRELARTLNNQVRDEIASDPDAAEPSLREAIVLSRRLTQDFPTVPEYWSELGGYLNNLGLALAERGRLKDDQASAEEAEGHFQEAEEAFRRCESIRKDLAARYPLRPEFRHRLALIRHNLSKFLRGRDQAEEAGVPLGTAIESLRSLVAEYPDVPEYQKDLALALLEQSSSFFSPGKDASQALALAEEAQRHAEESLQDRLDDQVYLDALRTVHLHRAWFFGNLGNHQESVEHARFLGENAFGNPRWLYLAAELQAQARSRVVHDEALSPDERQSLQERYLEEAASWLNRAADAGFRRIDFAEAQFGAYAEREQIRRALERIRGTADESR